MMLEHLDHLADASAQAISNIKFDKVVVWEGGGQDGSSATANFLQNISRSLPPMLQVMKDIGGIEIPETLARFEEEPPKEPAPSSPSSSSSPPPPAPPASVSIES